MYGVYAAHFLRGIATLTLAMTRKFNCLCERSEANSREGGGLRSIFSVLFQGDCRGTSCLAMTTSRAMVRWDISLTLNMTCLIPYRLDFRLFREVSLTEKARGISPFCAMLFNGFVFRPPGHSEFVCVRFPSRFKRVKRFTRDLLSVIAEIFYYYRA